MTGERYFLFFIFLLCSSLPCSFLCLYNVFIVFYDRTSTNAAVYIIYRYYIMTVYIYNSLNTKQGSSCCRDPVFLFTTDRFGRKLQRLPLDYAGTVLLRSSRGSRSTAVLPDTRRRVIKYTSDARPPGNVVRINDIDRFG